MKLNVDGKPINFMANGMIAISSSSISASLTCSNISSPGVYISQLI
jgi:hypothetical protein